MNRFVFQNRHEKGSPRTTHWANTAWRRLKAAGWALIIGVAWAGAVPESLLAADPIELDPILQNAEEARVRAIEKAMPSAVSVFVPGGNGGGSGVLISPDGFALTNFHVTSPAGSYMRCGLSDGNIYDAVIVGIDPVGDLALIRLLGKDEFPAAELGSSRRAEVGDWCMVIGNPFLLASNLQPTVTWGILSGVGRYQYPSGTLLEYGDCLQTDASINPGNSGGPLYDAEGRLLGIVGRASFEKRGRVNVGVGYAISINQAKNFLGYLHSGRIVDHATLGATVATDPDGGVSVSNILESSDAYRRGLRYGAEILEIDGRVVQTANDVQNVLATFPKEWRIKLTYRLEGKTTETLVRLRSVHRQDELLEKMAGALPPPPPRPPKPEPGDDPDQDDAEPGDTEPGDSQEPKRLIPETPPQQPRGFHKLPKRDSIPEVVEAQLQERKGYANYHFNLEHQQRFIEALRQQFPGGKQDQAVSWKIEAETIAENPIAVQIHVSEDRLALIADQEVIDADDRSEIYDEISLGSVTGLLGPLDAWRRMLQYGPRKFGESYYLGTMPLGGERPLRDCMIGIDGEIEVRWLSHPETRRVEVIEAFADRDADPAELWITWPQAERAETDGSDASPTDRKVVPTELDLRYGLESRLRLRIKSWESVDASSDDAKDAKDATDEADKSDETESDTVKEAA